VPLSAPRSSPVFAAPSLRLSVAIMLSSLTSWRVRTVLGRVMMKQRFAGKVGEEGGRWLREGDRLALHS